jgi:probable HAF family extracellular repeat protein
VGQPSRIQGAVWDGAAGSGAINPVVLPGLGGQANLSTSAFGINNDGFVVGESNDGTGFKAVLWKVTKSGVNQFQVASPAILSPLAGDVAAAAYGINDSGRVVGESRNAAGLAHAVYWDAVNAGTINAAAPAQQLAGPGGAFYSAAYAIDDAGDIAGEAEDNTAAHAVHAAVWVVGVTGYSFKDLGTTANVRSAAYGVNDRGHVVGEATQVAGGAKLAVVWDIVDVGTAVFELTLLGPNAVATPSNALAVNAEGRIAGWLGSASVPAGLTSVWDTNRVNIATPVTAVPAAAANPSSQGFGVNAKGTIVGMRQGAAGDEAFMVAQQLP